MIEFDKFLTHSLINDPPQNWSPHFRVNATFHGYSKASVCSPPTILSPSISGLEPQCLSFRLPEGARIESYPFPLPLESRRSAVLLVICYCKIERKWTLKYIWNISYILAIRTLTLTFIYIYPAIINQFPFTIFHQIWTYGAWFNKWKGIIRILYTRLPRIGIWWRRICCGFFSAVNRIRFGPNTTMIWFCNDVVV